MALPKQYRLKLRRDFQDVYQSGIRRTGRFLNLRALRQRPRQTSSLSERQQDAMNATSASPCLQGEEKPPTKIGISISQKVSKRAVVRNRIKRRIRAALRQLLPRISPGWRLVVGVRATAIECNYVEILRELEQLLVEAEVLNGHS